MALGIWIWYLIGQLIHTLLQLSAVSKAKNNPAGSVLQAFKQRWLAVVARLFVATAFFLLVANDPQIFLRILSAIGLTFDPGPAGIKMSAGLAGLFGYFADSLLGFIPGLKGTVPTISRPGDE